MTFLRISRFVLFTTVIICLPFKGTAEAPGNQLWPTIVVEKGLKAGAKIEFEQQLRLQGQTPLFDQTFSEFRFSSLVSGDLGVTLYYRQIFYPDKMAYRIAASTQVKSLPFLRVFGVRAMLQRQQSHDVKPTYYARLRGTLNLRHPQGSTLLFLQGEPWLMLDDQQSWKRYRLGAGINYQLSQRLSASVFYHYQSDNHEDGWSGTNILGIGLKTML